MVLWSLLFGALLLATAAAVSLIAEIWAKLEVSDPEDVELRDKRISRYKTASATLNFLGALVVACGSFISLGRDGLQGNLSVSVSTLFFSVLVLFVGRNEAVIRRIRLKQSKDRMD